MALKRLRDLDDWQLQESGQDIRGWPLLDRSGQSIGTIEEMIVNTDRQEVDTVVLDNGAEYPVRDLQLGDHVVYLGMAETRAGDVGSLATGGPMDTAMRVIPIIEEEIVVGKRQVERGGVRLQEHVTERPVEEQINLREQKVRVDRRPVNRPVSDEALSGSKDEVIELTETNEEPVISKTARVVEEVSIGKEVKEHQEAIRGTVRKSNVRVEEINDDRGDDRRKS